MLRREDVYNHLDWEEDPVESYEDWVNAATSAGGRELAHVVICLQLAHSRLPPQQVL
jgi:hypothetical protein